MVKFPKMSNEMDQLAAMANEEKKESGKTSDYTQVTLTDTDADALRAFRKGKPLAKTGTALVDTNGARLKNIIANKIADEFHGINEAPNKFLLVCEAVAEVRDNDGNVIHPAKPAAQAKISVKPDSYCTHHGLSKDVYDRIAKITHDLLLEEGEPQFVDRHFTMSVNPVIKFGSVPPALRKDVLDAITRLRNLQVEVTTEEGTKVITMPADAIQIVPKYFPKSTFHDARRTELDQATNIRLEKEGIQTSQMIT
jgi:hypothetical protein